MSLNRCLATCVLLCAAACGPKLSGLCTSDAQCKADETCASGGFCVVRADGNGGDGGPSDGGDGGVSDGGDGGVSDGGDGGVSDGGDGGASDGGDGGVLVDPTLPAISGVQVEGPPDAVDSNRVQWFRGPTLAPVAPSLDLSAVISPQNSIASATATLPDGTPQVVGTFANVTGRWHFAVPRSVGLHSTGSVTILFDAVNAAGKHAVALVPYILHFDDTPAAGFTPVIAKDDAWYARADGGVVSVAVSFLSPPPSGFKSLTLQVGQGTVLPPNSADGGTASFALPTTLATAGTEGPLSFTVTATSVVLESTAASASRLVDDLPPQQWGAATVLYPPYDSTNPLAFGHDGLHFNVRDNAQLVKFMIYDCGSGLAAGSASVTRFALSTGPSSIAVTDTGSTTACPNRQPAHLFSVIISADLAGQTSLPTAYESRAAASAAARDQVSAAHTLNLSADVLETRALWASSAMGAANAAVGPGLFVTGTNGLYRFDKLTGASAQWSALPAVTPPSVAATSSSATVFWGDSKLRSADANSTTPPAAGAIVSCGTFTNPTGLVLSDGSTAIGSGYKTASRSVCTKDCCDPTFCKVLCQSCTTEYYNVYSTVMLGATTASCTAALSGLPTIYTGGAAVGRSSTLFSLSSAADAVEARSFLGTLLSSSPLTSGSSLIITDNGTGADRVLVNDSGGGKRVDFVSNAFTPMAAMGALVPYATTAAVVFASTSSGLAFYDFTGAAQTAPVGGQAAALLSATAPWGMVYLGGTGNPNPTLFALPGGVLANDTMFGGLPAGPVTDMVQAANGILYVVSGGRVFAVVTDAPGMAIGTTAAPLWPGRQRDACKSSNLSYACPY